MIFFPGDDRVNIFKNLEKEQYKIARHNVVDMILATEMTKHFEHLAKFVNVFCTKPASNPEGLCNSEVKTKRQKQFSIFLIIYIIF